MVYCLILLGLSIAGPIVVIGVMASLGAVIGYIVSICSLICYLITPIFRFIKRIINFLRNPRISKGVV